MRVGLIAPPWLPVPPLAYGGTETVIDSLARGLKGFGHDVKLFTVGESTCPVQRDHLFPRALEPIGVGITEAAHVLAAYESLADCDIIHDHTVLGPVISGSRGRSSPPVVVTNHGPFNTMTRRVFAEVAKTASVVAISAAQAQRAGKVPITAVIHHGIDLDVYQPGPGGGGYLIFIGRMSPEKGVATAIRIAEQAGLPLRIVTKMRDDTEANYYEREVRPLLGADALEPEELGLQARVELLQHADALLNPIAWSEPFGLVMIESLASATPVVAFPHGAAPEIVDHGRTGYLCSTERLAVSALQHLAAIDRADCRAAAEDRFSHLRMARDYEALYERVLERGRVPAQGVPLWTLPVDS